MFQSDKSDFQLLLMNEDDYPKFPEFNADKQIVLEDEKIKELIKKTILPALQTKQDLCSQVFSGTPGW